MNAVGRDKNVLEEVGEKMKEEDTEDDTMVNQVGNAMHACKTTNRKTKTTVY